MRLRAIYIVCAALAGAAGARAEVPRDFKSTLPPYQRTMPPLGDPEQDAMEAFIKRLPPAHRAQVRLDIMTALFTPDLIKGYAGMEGIVVDAGDFMQGDFGPVTPQKIEAFRQWAATNAKKLLEFIDSGMGGQTPPEEAYNTLLGSFSSQGGGSFVFGNNIKKFVVVDIPLTLREVMDQETALDILIDIHYQSGAYAKMPLQGNPDFKPQAVTEALKAAREHGGFAESIIEAYVRKAMFGDMQTGHQIFLTWYAQTSGINEPWKHPEAMKALASELDDTLIKFAMQSDDVRLRIAKGMIAGPNGIAATYAQGWLEGVGQHNPKRSMGSFVKRLPAAPADKLVPKR